MKRTLILMMLLTVPAHAGAWMQQEGSGLSITTLSYGRALRAFDANGKPISAVPYLRGERRHYFEFGLYENLTLIANSGEVVDDWFDGSERGLAEYWGPRDIGMRMRIYEGDGTAISLEHSLHLPASARLQIERGLGPDTRSLETRLLVGHGFTLLGVPIFIESEAAYRYRLGQANDEVALDFVLGVTPFEDWQLLAQSFNTIGMNSYLGYASMYRENKLQLSAVYQVTDRVSFQLGGYRTIAGEGVAEEEGILAAMWVRY